MSHGPRSRTSGVLTVVSARRFGEQSSDRSSCGSVAGSQCLIGAALVGRTTRHIGQYRRLSPLQCDIRPLIGFEQAPYPCAGPRARPS